MATTNLKGLSGLSENEFWELSEREQQRLSASQVVFTIVEIRSYDHPAAPSPFSHIQFITFESLQKEHLINCARMVINDKFDSGLSEVEIVKHSTGEACFIHDRQLHLSHSILITTLTIK